MAGKTKKEAIAEGKKLVKENQRVREGRVVYAINKPVRNPKTRQEEDSWHVKNVRQLQFYKKPQGSKESEYIRFLADVEIGRIDPKESAFDVLNTETRFVLIHDPVADKDHSLTKALAALNPEPVKEAEPVKEETEPKK